MYHYYVTNAGCGNQVSKTQISRTDNIHTDAGERDENGLHNITLEAVHAVMDPPRVIDKMPAGNADRRLRPGESRYVILWTEQ